MVRVRLEHDDSYTVDFFRLKGVDCNPLERFRDVYADQLRAIFTKVTGMVLSL